MVLFLILLFAVAQSEIFYSDYSLVASIYHFGMLRKFEGKVKGGWSQRGIFKNRRVLRFREYLRTENNTLTFILSAWYSSHEI